MASFCPFQKQTAPFPPSVSIKSEMPYFCVHAGSAFGPPSMSASSSEIFSRSTKGRTDCTAAAAAARSSFHIRLR